jgi:hypothetical protein
MSWDEEFQNFEYLARTAPSEDPDTLGKNMNVAHHEELEALVKDAAAAMKELDNAEFEGSDELDHY